MAGLIHTPQNLTATKTLFNFNGDINTLPFYKILIGFLFCIFLGGCSGSSSSKSSTNDNSSAEEKEEEKTQPKECKVENCGVRPTVSLRGGELQNLRQSNATAFSLGGDCSVDGSNNVKVSVKGSSSSVRTTASCTGGAWVVEMDLSTLVNEKKILVVMATHVDTVGRQSLFAQSTFNTFCPDNYVLVPSLRGYTIDPFCVSKYEMRNVSSVATATAVGNPWRALTRNTAKTKCSDLGSGYSLMTNDEWQTVARNIELVPGSWGGGTVGSAQGLSIGNSGSAIQPASVDDNEACSGITLGASDTCDSRTWHANRRTFTLSNQQVIWDVAGNVWEWMKDRNMKNYGTNAQIALFDPQGAHRTKYALSIDGLDGISRYAKDQFGPAGDYRALSTAPHGGLGYGWISYSNKGTVGRGGSHKNQGKGLFSVNLMGTATGSYANIGFRCAYHLPEPEEADVALAVCQAGEEEERATSDGKGREYRTCVAGGKSWSGWRFKSCSTGYTLNTDTYECYRAEQACGSGNIELLRTDGSGDYEHCGARPTVSLHGGELRNLRKSTLGLVTMKGDCSVDGSDNVQVSVKGASSFVKAVASCTGGAWEVEMDLLALVDEKDAFVVKAIHVDTEGRQSLFAQSTFNTLCPDNYVLVPPLSGYTTDPFCVAKYEMKGETGLGGLVQSTTGNVKFGFHAISTARDTLLQGQCSYKKGLQYK